MIRNGRLGRRCWLSVARSIPGRLENPSNPKYFRQFSGEDRRVLVMAANVQIRKIHRVTFCLNLPPAVFSPPRVERVTSPPKRSSARTVTPGLNDKRPAMLGATSKFFAKRGGVNGVSKTYVAQRNSRRGQQAHRQIVEIHDHLPLSRLRNLSWKPNRPDR